MALRCWVDCKRCNARATTALTRGLLLYLDILGRMTQTCTQADVALRLRRDGISTNKKSTMTALFFTRIRDCCYTLRSGNTDGYCDSARKGGGWVRAWVEARCASAGMGNVAPVAGDTAMALGRQLGRRALPENARHQSCCLFATLLAPFAPQKTASGSHEYVASTTAALFRLVMVFLCRVGVNAVKRPGTGPPAWRLPKCGSINKLGKLA